MPIRADGNGAFCDASARFPRYLEDYPSRETPMTLATMLVVMPLKQMIIVRCIESRRASIASNRLST
jgi:hypothetical protein